MLQKIKTHNTLNGFVFSIVEFIVTALILAPFALYYVMYGRMLYASVAFGIILNCLTISGIGIQQYLRKEKDVGIQHLFDKNYREQIGRENPQLSRDTLILSTSILLPFVLLIWVFIDAFQGE